MLERHVGYFAWANHLQDAYYDQRSLPQWTLKEDPTTRTTIPTPTAIRGAADGRHPRRTGTTRPRPE